LTTIDGGHDCARIRIDCRFGNALQNYYIAYTNGIIYYSFGWAHFECNATAQLWQNDYLSQYTGDSNSVTAKNFICYRLANATGRNVLIITEPNVFVFNFSFQWLKITEAL
jgi:hypothetical protein